MPASSHVSRPLTVRIATDRHAEACEPSLWSTLVSAQAYGGGNGRADTSHHGPGVRRERRLRTREVAGGDGPAGTRAGAQGTRGIALQKPDRRVGDGRLRRFAVQRGLG